jgi:alpha-tubulin suppressor-like RCC1 family protein
MMIYLFVKKIQTKTNMRSQFRKILTKRNIELLAAVVLVILFGLAAAWYSMRNTNFQIAKAAPPVITGTTPTTASTLGGDSVAVQGIDFLDFDYITQVSAGANHTCGLYSNGRARCWGLGTSGQLGYGNNITIGDNETPATTGYVDVGGTVTQISTGTDFTCALLTTGNVRCWGLGTSGQLGYGNTNNIGDNETPASAGDVNVGGLVKSISAGGSHICAVLTSDEVKCWGLGSNGKLGNAFGGNIGDNELPSVISSIRVGAPVLQVAVGLNHACALINTGNVRCWGNSFQGQLGYGNNGVVGDDEYPFQAGDVNVGDAVTQISAGTNHTCALLTTGNVRCWGLGTNGQLGYGNTNTIGDNELPSSVGTVSLGGTVKQISVGTSYTCALMTTNAVKCWGLASSGQLGYGNTTAIGDNELPSSIGNVSVGGTAIVTQISSGGTHTCVRFNTGYVKCWGAGTSGRLGYSNIVTIGDNELPSTISNVVSTSIIPPTITFGGVNATSMKFVSVNQIDTVVPNGSTGTAPVLLTNSQGTSTLSNQFFYGTTILGSDITSSNCSPNSIVALSATTCSASFTSGKAGTITFSTSPDIGSCTTTSIAFGDTTKACTLTTTTVGSSVAVNATASGTGTFSAGTLTATGTLPNNVVVLSPANNSFTNSANPTFTGTAQANTVVNLRNTAGNIVCTTTSDSLGNFSCTLITALSEGANTINLTQIDSTTGLTSLATNVIITIDTITPYQPTVVTPYTGSSFTLQTPQIIGKSESGSSITVTDQNNDILCTAITNSNEDWACTSSNLTPGSHSIKALAKDTANNSSVLSIQTDISILSITSVSPNQGSVDGNNPVSVLGTGFSDYIPVKQAALGQYFGCSLLVNGKVRCWGNGTDGKRGYNDPNRVLMFLNETPDQAGDVNIGGTVTQISAGTNHTCALLDTGNVRCWGLGTNGRLGYGNTNTIGDDETPASAGDVNVGGVVTQISARGNSTCALLNTGNIRCWGSATSGKLGYGNINDIGDNETPASAGDVNVGGTVKEISVGGSHTCALLTTSNIRCWGNGFGGMLGYGGSVNIGDDETPASIGDVNVGGAVRKITLGANHTCALLITKKVRCWGSQFFGNLGLGVNISVGDDETITSVPDVNIGGNVSVLQTNNRHSCVQLENNAVRCWGWGANAELGYGNTNSIGDDETPASAGDVNTGVVTKELFTGSYHNCILMLTGKLKCWGFAGNGELGYGTNANIGDDETPATVGRVKVSSEIAPTVTFDSLLATNVNLSTINQLTLTLPPHPEGFVNVSVTNFDGQTTNLTSGYRYLPNCALAVAGTQDSACIDVNISSGVLAFETPESISLGSIVVSNEQTTATGLVSPVTITDSRGLGLGWTASCKIANFVGQTHPDQIIPVATDTSNGTSRFRLTPTALATTNINSNALENLIDRISTQNTTSMTSPDSSGESNSFPIAEFPVGYGYGSYYKDLGLQLDVPAFVRAQAYNSVLTCSVG